MFPHGVGLSFEQLSAVDQGYIKAQTKWLLPRSPVQKNTCAVGEKVLSHLPEKLLHLNIALIANGGFQLYFGVEKATWFKWLQHVSFSEPCTA